MTNTEEAEQQIKEAQLLLEKAQYNLKLAKESSEKSQFILDKLHFYNPKLVEERPCGSLNVIEIEMDGQYHLFQDQHNLGKIARNGYFIGAVETITDSTRLRLKFFSF